MDQNWSKGRRTAALSGTVLLVLGGGIVALGALGGAAEPVVNLAAAQNSPNIPVLHVAPGLRAVTYGPSPASWPSAPTTAPVARTTAPAAAPTSAPPIMSAAKSAVVVHNAAKPPASAAAPHASASPPAAPHTSPPPAAAPPPANEAVTVSGFIECQSQGVEGVWIQAANGDSGWAPWVSSAANPGYATYQYTLDSGGQYAVHVGCGGTPSSWAVATYSDYFSGPANDFFCYNSGGADYTYCARVGGS